MSQAAVSRYLVVKVNEKSSVSVSQLRSAASSSVAYIQSAVVNRLAHS